jgi:catechol 2,3-dioxygenase-like lactoylglutathione lyase family enzyme
MLRDHASSAIVAVRNIAGARAFYEGTLGLERVEGGGDGPLVYRTGPTHLVVYVSEFAGTNQANTVVWGVGNQLEAIAADLSAKGVRFEHYDVPGATYADGIHRTGDFRMVWFKDPDGNILHLNSGA